MKIYKNITELIGNTPLIEVYADEKTGSRVVAKLEMYNPAGSSKDRAALYMIEDAEKKGLLKKGGTIIEPTSGNTGIGLAAISTVKGYKVILTMPDTMSIERRKLLSAYGAEIVLTDGKLGMEGAVQKALELKESIKDAFIPDQFNNPANPLSHQKTTAVEIFEDTEGKVDIIVAGVGTGGTLSGISKYLKEKNPDIKAIGVEPYESQVIKGEKAAPHGIQGIGANFIPSNFKEGYCDEIIPIKSADALCAMKALASEQGIFAGISSGAAFCGGVEIAKREKDKLIVVIFPDTGSRYLSEF